MILNYVTMATLLIDMYSSLAGVNQLMVPGDEGNPLVRHPGHDESYCKEGNKCQRVPAPHQLLSNFGESEDPRKLAREREAHEERNRKIRETQRRHWTQKDRDSFDNRPLPIDHEKTDYQFHVHDAQNSTVCNYTVIPIPNPGGRIPRELEHVKCNNVSSRCQGLASKCCIQLFRYVEVVYEGGKSEKIKLYSGCVCSLRPIYGTLEPYMPELEINY